MYLATLVNFLIDYYNKPNILIYLAIQAIKSIDYLNKLKVYFDKSGKTSKFWPDKSNSLIKSIYYTLFINL